MSYNAKCGHCGHQWKLPEVPGYPMSLDEAFERMDKAACAMCGNDATRAPIHWEMRFRPKNWGKKTA